MTKQKLSKARLVINGIGSLGVAIICIAVSLSGIVGLITGTMRIGDDADGGDKVLGLQILTAILGVLALISFIRTVKAWRELSKT
jgi:hypothetical protein